MKNLSLFLGACIVLLPSIGIRAYGADARAEIKKLEDQWANAVKRKDATAVMKCYEPGKKLFVFDVVPPRQYTGSDAYKKDWEDTFDMLDGPITFEISDLAIETGTGDIAYGHSIQHLTGKLKKGGDLDVTVRVTDVYRRAGGKWLISHEHVSVPVDLDSGKADLQSKP